MAKIGKGKRNQDGKMFTEDARFSQVHSDPRFIRPKKQTTKVVVDERFKDLFEDDADAQSRNQSRVDKYGRKVGKSHDKDQLKNFYRLDGDSDQKKGVDGSDSGEENDEQERSDSEGRQKDFVDYARGEVLMSSSEDESSGEDESSEDESSDADEVEFGNYNRRRRPSSESSEPEIDLDEDGLLPTSKEKVEDSTQDHRAQPTNRLAVVDLDWDNVRAMDIFKVLSCVLSLSAPEASSLPPTTESQLADGKTPGTRIARGYLKSVSIFPSQFGKARMEKENQEGPPKEIFMSSRGTINDELFDGGEEGEGAIDLSESDQEKDSDQEEEFNQRALRKYQLERLRYYYAIAEFNSVAAATHAYDEIDGTEFEATANTFDLSYVPDHVTFDEEPTDIATADSGRDYKGVDFTTDALRNSKVKLTWDADNPDRIKITKSDRSKMDKRDIEKMDYQNFLASASSTSEDEGVDSESESEAAGENGKEAIADKRVRLRGLLGLNKSTMDTEEGEMQVTFAPALEQKVEEGPPKDQETSLDTYKRKEKERKERKKERRRAEHKESSDGEKESSEGIVGSGESGVTDGEEDLGFDDPFFQDQENTPNLPQKKEKPRIGVGKGSKEGTSPRDEKEVLRTERELSLLVDDAEEGDDRHFDMKEIMRNEKNSQTKKKGSKKSKRKGEPAAPDDFDIDVNDTRFDRLFEDYEFALDPSNPHFTKTKAMKKLLDSSQQKRAESLKYRANGEEPNTSSGIATNGTSSENVNELVKNLKRKSKFENDNRSRIKQRKN